MAELKRGELSRIRKVNNDKDGGNGLSDPNAGFVPTQSIEGPGACVTTPLSVSTDSETKEPRMTVKGTGKESARIDHGYSTLAAGLKDGKTDF